MQKFFNDDLDINNKIYIIGNYSFYIGVVLLASALGISIIFLLISLLISFLKPQNFLKDKWNFPLILSGLLMCISSLVHFNTGEIKSSLNLDPNLSLIGLTNWIPLFLCFWGFQKYLDTHNKRVLTSKLLIIGSIPVIFSGILQLLNINGPFQIFYGLVVWFQKPLSDIGSVSGLFNNQNYAGLWMVMVWPFCLSTLTTPNKSYFKRIVILLISISFICFISLTDSRNAFLGLLISSPIVLGSSSLIWYLPTLILGFTIFALSIFPIFPVEIQSIMKSIIPSRIYTMFPEIGFEYFGKYPRILKLRSAISFILERPLFGWGAASFPVLYQLESGEWFGHAHNLPLEIALSYGIFSSIIIFSTYILLLIFTFKQLNAISRTNKFKMSKSHERAWWASSLIFLLSHLVDIQYFDARISILCWLLLAGLRSFLREMNETNLLSSK